MDHEPDHEHEHGLLHGHDHEPDPERDLENEELIESAGMLGFVVVPIVKGYEWLRERTWGKGKPSATPDSEG